LLPQINTCFLYMKNIIAFLLYCLSITAVIGQASGDTRLRVAAQSPSETLLYLDLLGTQQAEVSTPRGKAITVSIEGGTPLLRASAPDLPKYATVLMIPATGSMAVEVTDAEFQDFPNVEVAPSKGDLKRNIDPARVPYEYGGAYARDEFFPNQVVDLQQPFVMRDARGQAVWIQPVQYNPVQKVLRVYSRLTLRVYPVGGTGINEMQPARQRPASRIFQQMQQKLFANYDRSLLRFSGENAARGGADPERMLVIAKDEFVDALQPLLAWKRQMGIHTTVATLSEIGASDATSVYNFVKQRYDSEGIAYLLVVGDEYAFVPEMRSDGGLYSCDNCYGYMEGTDHFPEILVGRFNAATAEQLNIMVNRNLEYEKSPVADPAALWWGTGMWSASNEGQGIGDDNQADYEHANDWKTKQLADGYDKHWEFYDGNHAAISPTPGDESADKSGNPVNTDLVNLMNGRGVSMYNYVGHGWEQGLVSGNFNVEAVSKLRNDHKFPFLIAVACCAGNFTNNAAGDCLGEAWQRAGNTADGTPWGGIAGFFSSDFQSWAPPMEGQDGMNQMLIDADGIALTPSIGSLLSFGNAKMIAAYAEGGELMADFWNPFAEPSTVPRTRLPRPIEAAHAAGLLIGQGSLTVTSPVEGALVSLYWQGQTLAVGIIESGSAVLSFPPLDNVGQMTLTLTQFNHTPYQSALTVAPAEGAFVVNQSTALRDLAGNNNGQADFAETLTFDLALANVGVEIATAATATLSTNDANVSIFDGEETFGDLAAGGILEKIGAFGFQVADDVQDGHVVNFDLKITFNTDKTYSAVIPVKLQAPNLSVTTIKISDLAGGDGDGRLESGETALVRIKNANLGKAASGNATGTLSTDSPWLSIASATMPLGPLAPGSTATEAVFSVTVAADAPQVVLANFDYTVTAGAYDAAKTFGPYTINPIVETFESKGFAEFPWTQSGNKPWQVTSPVAYTGAYSSRSGTIGHNQKSQMTLTLQLSADGTLTFARRVSCEKDFDFLKFYIDSVEVAAWTGEVAWGEVSFPVTAGVHRFLWSYEKDGLGVQGSDRAWVDDISMPPYKVSVGTGGPTDHSVTALLSPNPTSGTAWLRLDLPPGSQQISIRVLDGLGCTVSIPLPLTDAPGGEFVQPIDLSQQRAGVYFVQVRTEAGTVLRKVVRE
jgi:hypothetical protein